LFSATSRTSTREPSTKLCHNVIFENIRTWIASPTRHDYYAMRSDAGSARIHLCLNKSAISHQLEALLDEPLGAPLEFAPAMDLRTGFGNSLARLILMVATDLHRAGSIYLAPVTMVALEQSVSTSLLTSHPHNYSTALRCRDKPIAPRDIKRAIDYMQAHLDAPIRLADIVQASGVPGRTLFKHFSDCRGLSPMRYLRNARLDKVRDAFRDRRDHDKRHSIERSRRSRPTSKQAQCDASASQTERAADTLQQKRLVGSTLGARDRRFSSHLRSNIVAGPP
jgi:AraC-like DNA-binding protein